MRKGDTIDEDEEPLVDTTVPIPLRSKRTERLQKKLNLKQTAAKQHATIWDLPSEIFLDIFTRLRPSDVFRLARANQSLRNFVLEQETTIASEIIRRRYPVLAKCFPLPVLLNTVDMEAHSALLDDRRQAAHLYIHKKPYQHIKTPDIHEICTCLTCLLAWNNLSLVVDFAHWQKNLEHGEPIPIIARGKNPEWNQILISANGDIVEKALYSQLWYAVILSSHLRSTTGSIHRHSNNKGNKRRRFRMTIEDVAAETDQFLERSGPPTLNFPHHRDNYYMLEAYLPNRGWNSETGEWQYIPASQHARDVEFCKAWVRRTKDSVVVAAKT